MTETNADNRKYVIEGLTFNQLIVMAQMTRLTIKSGKQGTFRYNASASGVQLRESGFQTEYAALEAAVKAVKATLSPTKMRVVLRTP